MTLPDRPDAAPTPSCNRGHMNRDKDIVALATQRAVENAALHSAAPAADGTVLKSLFRQRDHRTRLVEVLHADGLAIVAEGTEVERE